MWLPKRFLALALRLRNNNFAPEIVVAPSERDEWMHLQDHGLPVRTFGSLNEVAEWIHESAWFIGNDSGLAHLASNVGVPAISLMVRNKIARRWRPGWTSSRAVLPLPILPGKIAKDLLWQRFLPVSRVMRAFADLRAATAR